VVAVEYTVVWSGLTGSFIPSFFGIPLLFGTVYFVHGVGTALGYGCD